MAFPSTAVLLLIAGVLLGLGLGAVLMRRWLAKRQTAEIEVPTPTVAPSSREQVAAQQDTAIQKAAAPALSVPAMAAPSIRFAARLKEGETKVEFTAPSDADEMTLEHSREFHE
jgi:hypothetical protein